MKKLIKIRGDKNFTTWRGGDVSRLENIINNKNFSQNYFGKIFDGNRRI